jgi:hypothetical protein
MNSNYTSFYLIPDSAYLVSHSRTFGKQSSSGACIKRFSVFNWVTGIETASICLGGQKELIIVVIHLWLISYMIPVCGQIRHLRLSCCCWRRHYMSSVLLSVCYKCYYLKIYKYRFYFGLAKINDFNGFPRPYTMHAISINIIGKETTYFWRLLLSGGSRLLSASFLLVERDVLAATSSRVQSLHSAACWDQIVRNVFQMRLNTTIM